MVNRTFFRVEFCNEAGVWLPVPYSSENYIFDEAVRSLEFVEMESNYSPLRIVRIAEEVVYER